MLAAVVTSIISEIKADYICWIIEQLLYGPVILNLQVIQVKSGCQWDMNWCVLAYRLCSSGSSFSYMLYEGVLFRVHALPFIDFVDYSVENHGRISEICVQHQLLIHDRPYLIREEIQPKGHKFISHCY